MPSNGTASRRTCIFKFWTAVTRFQIESSEHLPLWQCHDFLTAASLHPAWPRDFSFKKLFISLLSGCPVKYWFAIASWVLWVTCQLFTSHVDLLLPSSSPQISAWWLAFSSLESLGIVPFAESEKRKEISLLKTLIFIGCVYPAQCFQIEGGHGPRTLSLHVGSR